jgi:hypothetical protein
MAHRHAVVWLDHVHAVVAHVGPSGNRFERIDPYADVGTPQLHRRSGPPGAGHRPPDDEFFEMVARALREMDEILVVGPGLAKGAFVRWLGAHHATTADRVVGVETVDHPTEAQLVAYAKVAFRRIDQLLGDH